MELIDNVSDMGKKFGNESTGVVCTPAKQTQLLVGLREMSKIDFERLFSCNLFLPDGRSSFAKHWNDLSFTEKLEWSERNEKECDGLNLFQRFFQFKKVLDVVNTAMVSAIEGNNRLMTFMHTAAERKVHPKSTIDENEPSDKERLTREYLRTKPSLISNTVLSVEGTTRISEGVEKVMSNTNELIIRVNATFPTKENDKTYPAAQMLMDCRELSADYARAKHDSNTKPSFDKVTEILNKCIARSEDGQAKYQEGDVLTYGEECRLKNKRTGTAETLLMTTTGKTKKGWADQFIELFNDSDLTDMKLQAKVNNETKKFPFVAESLKQINEGEKHRKDLTELSLLMMCREMITYCCTTVGDASQQEIDERVEKIVADELLNLSESKKFTKMKQLGSENHRGTCAFIMIQSFYTVGCIYRKQDKVLRLFDSLGKGQISQKQHWNGLSKYTYVIIFFARSKNSHTAVIALNLLTDIGLMYGILSAYTDIAYTTILWTIDDKLKHDLDSQFLWNSVFHGIMDMMLDILDKYGYNPSLRDDVKGDHFPKVDSIRNYFLHGGSYAEMRKDLWSFGSKEFRKRIGQKMGSANKWNHLYESGKPGQHTQRNPHDNLLVVLLIFVLDKAVKLEEMQQEHDEKKQVTVNDLLRHDLWAYGINKEFDRYSTKGRTALGVRVDGNDVEPIEDPAVWIQEQSNNFVPLDVIIDVLFVPKDGSAVEPGNAGAKLTMLWKKIDEKKKASPRKRKTGADPEKGRKKQAKESVEDERKEDTAAWSDDSSASVDAIESSGSIDESEQMDDDNEAGKDGDTITTNRTEDSRATAHDIVNNENNKEMLENMVRLVLENQTEFPQLHALLPNAERLSRKNDDSSKEGHDDDYSA